MPFRSLDHLGLTRRMAQITGSDEARSWVGRVNCADRTGRVSHRAWHGIVLLLHVSTSNSVLSDFFLKLGPGPLLHLFADGAFVRKPVGAFVARDPGMSGHVLQLHPLPRKCALAEQRVYVPYQG